MNATTRHTQNHTQYSSPDIHKSEPVAAQSADTTHGTSNTHTSRSTRTCHCYVSSQFTNVTFMTVKLSVPANVRLINYLNGWALVYKGAAHCPTGIRPWTKKWSGPMCDFPWLASLPLSFFQCLTLLVGRQKRQPACKNTQRFFSFSFRRARTTWNNAG